MKQNTITLIKPDDWHLHLRDSTYLKTTVKDAAREFSRAIVMPNLVPPITDLTLAKSYREQITIFFSIRVLLRLVI